VAGGGAPMRGTLLWAAGEVRPSAHTHTHSGTTRDAVMTHLEKPRLLYNKLIVFY
jgi:hypothetical protein